MFVLWNSKVTFILLFILSHFNIGSVTAIKSSPVKICEAPKLPDTSKCVASKSKSVRSTSKTILPTQSAAISKRPPTPSTTETIARPIFSNPKTMISAKPAFFPVSIITRKNLNLNPFTLASKLASTVLTPHKLLQNAPDEIPPETENNSEFNLGSNNNENEANNDILIKKDNLVKRKNFGKGYNLNGYGDSFCTVDDELHAEGTHPICSKAEWKVRDNSATLSIQYPNHSRRKRDVVGQRVPLTPDEKEQLERLYGSKFNLEAAELVKAMRLNIPTRHNEGKRHRQRQQEQEPLQHQQQQQRQPFGYYNPRYNNQINENSNPNRPRRQSSRQQTRFQNQQNNWMGSKGFGGFYGKKNQNREYKDKNRHYKINTNQRFMRDTGVKRQVSDSDDGYYSSNFDPQSKYTFPSPEEIPSGQGRGQQLEQENIKIQNTENNHSDPALLKRSDLIKMLVDELKEDTKHHEEDEEDDEQDECSLYGTWLSPIAGVAIELQPVGKAILVHLENLPDVPPQNRLLSNSWIGTVMISPVSPTTITLLFQEPPSSSHESTVTPSTAVFIGQCVYCKGGTAIQGSWVIFSGSRTCLPPAIASISNDTDTNNSVALVNNLNPSAPERMYRRYL